MIRIKATWGALIAEACKFSSVPESFLAALISIESNGEANATRFEKHVFNALMRVQAGYKENYGRIRREQLSHLTGGDIKNLATSWGLTQVMGYHVLGRPGGLEILRDPASHLKFACGLLGEFAEKYGLNVRLEFEEMFRCWNSGAPYDDPKTPRIEGRTHDPKYVENGLRRMEIYKQVSGVAPRLSLGALSEAERGYQVPGEQA